MARVRLAPGHMNAMRRAERASRIERPRLEQADRLFLGRPRLIRLDAAYWGLKLIA